jgi:hypothetical protein
VASVDMYIGRPKHTWYIVNAFFDILHNDLPAGSGVHLLHTQFFQIEIVRISRR